MTGISTLALILAVAPSGGKEAEIYVSEARLFSPRALAQKLQKVGSELGQLTGINSEAIKGAFGNVQGVSFRGSALGVSLLSQPIPGVQTAVTQVPDAEKNLNTSQVVTTTTAPQQTATAPQPPAGFPDIAAAKGTIGVDPAQLLGRQVALLYEAINYQMLLDQALTDQVVVTSDVTEQKTVVRYRTPALLGFNVNLQPTPAQKGMAAEVQVKVMVEDHGSTKPLVSAMMPKDRTYNTIAATNDVTQIGLGGFLGAFSLGIGGGTQRATSYLVADVDTVAIRRDATAAEGRAAVFGWQFRPTLGRATVEPGTRELFALISIPNKSIGTPDEPLKLNVQVTTTWRSYDSKTRSVGKEDKQSRNVGRQYNVLVGNPFDPVVSTVSLQHLTPDKSVVNLDGGPFFSSPELVIADALSTPLELEAYNAKMMRVAVSPARLALYDFGLVNVTGNVVPLSYASDKKLFPGLRILQAHITEVDSTTSEVELSIVPRFGNPRARVVFHDKLTPLVVVSDLVFGIPNRPYRLELGEKGAPDRLVFRCPTSKLAESRTVSIGVPLHGADYRQSFPITLAANGLDIATILRLRKENGKVFYAATGRGLSNHVSVFNGASKAEDVKSEGDSLLTFSFKESEIGATHFIFQKGGLLRTFELSPPAQPVRPIVKSVEAHAAGKDSVRVEGTNLKLITKVVAGNQTMKLRFDDKKQAFMLDLDATLLSVGGPYSLLFEVDNGPPIIIEGYAIAKR